MKIRNCFVSNSSSSSFIVAVTRDLQLTEKQKEKLLEEHEWNLEDEDVEETEIKAEDILKEALDYLCKEEVLWEENCKCSVRSFISLISIDKDLNKRYCIATTSQQSREGQYINVLSDKNKKKFLNLAKDILNKD